MDVDRVPESLQRLVGRYRIPGVQLAIHNRGTITTIQIGDDEHGRGGVPAGASKFPIGSISRAFTATMAMILVGEGELDTLVVEYIPELRAMPGDLSARLILRHLLTYTGGQPDDEVPGTPTGVRVTFVLIRRTKQLSY